MFKGKIMIKINPIPEKENLSDEKLLRILKDICSASGEYKIQELRKLLKAMNVEVPNGKGNPI